MGRIQHKEDAFYVMLREFSESLIGSGESYAAIMRDYPDCDEAIARMKEDELACDQKVRALLELCSRSFITPFDREDISAATRGMDDVIDGMEGVVCRLGLFSVKEIKPEAIELADLTLQAIRELNAVFVHLPDFKRDTMVMVKVVEVSRLEDEGDKVYRNALASLYHTKKDPIEVIKWNGLFDKMEQTIDSCERTANVIQGVIVKNA